VFDVRLDLTKLNSISEEACLYLMNAKKRMQAKNGRFILQDAEAPELIKQSLNIHGL
jgi:hypothetical protein